MPSLAKRFTERNKVLSAIGINIKEFTEQKSFTSIGCTLFEEIWKAVVDLRIMSIANFSFYGDRHSNWLDRSYPLVCKHGEVASGTVLQTHNGFVIGKLLLKFPFQGMVVDILQTAFAVYDIYFSEMVMEVFVTGKLRDTGNEGMGWYVDREGFPAIGYSLHGRPGATEELIARTKGLLVQYNEAMEKK